MITLSHPLILASSSPRRKEILESVGLQFRVEPSNYQEPLHSDHLSEPVEFAKLLASEKGKEVNSRISDPSYILSADTIGLLGDVVLEKPSDREDAKRMLQVMSGKTHQIITALCLFAPGRDEPYQDVVITKVGFRELSEQEIENYLDVANYSDKAAAYAIQEHAAVFVNHIEGDYFNIVGLPIATVWKRLIDHEKSE